MHRMRAVDLFCGTGGFSRGAHAADFDVVAAYDFDPNLTYSYGTNFPNAKLFHKDISTLKRLARISFEPLLLTQYADGQRMFTATILARANSEQLPVGVLDWEFRANGWSQVHEISVPDLSLKERAVVDQNLHRSPSQIIRFVKFVPGENEEEAKAALRSYKQFHRFYPAFSPIAVS